MMNSLDYALAYARLGWRVFPTRVAGETYMDSNSGREKVSNGKEPNVGKGGFKRATANVDQITQWWSKTPGLGIGLWPGPSGLLVLDIDIKDGKQGYKQWQALQDRLEQVLPPTLKQHSPSGGWHLFFRLPPDVQISCSKIAGCEDIDIRAHGGYVCLEGTKTHAGGYSFEDWDALADGPPLIANAPEWLISLLCQVKKHDETAQEVSQDLASEVSQVEDVTEHQDSWKILPTALRESIARGAEVGDRSEEFHGVVARCKELGLRQSEITTVLLKHPNGIASKYAGRIQDEVDRSWRKLDAVSRTFNRGRIFERSKVEIEWVERSEFGQDVPWPEPASLSESIAPEPYPLEALPTSLREAVEEVHSFVQAPVAMVATSALSAVSIAAQALHDVKRAEKLTGPISLYTLVLADSGERKTTCDELFMNPIKEWQRAQAQAMQTEIEKYEASMAAWQAEYEGILAKIKQQSKSGRSTTELKKHLSELQAQKPVRLRVPRLTYSDITPEELGYRLAKHWPSAAITSSEGGSVLGAHGMTGDSAMRNMARLNDLWSGQEISSDRRTTESWVARGARLTVGLQVQESTLLSFFDKSQGLARGTGFLARFLVAWPPSTQGIRLFKESPGHWPKHYEYEQTIARILSVSASIDEDGVLTPSLLQLSPEAKAYWVEYHDEVEKRLAVGGDYADVRDVASKSADNAARLAACIHIFEHGSGAIGLDAMEAGCMLAAWHLQESLRFFGEIAIPTEIADALRLIRWAVEYARTRGGTVKHRDLQRRGPLRQGDRLNAALLVLQENHYVRLLREGRGKFVEINPALMR